VTPRQEMYERLPHFVQPFLNWVTAIPHFDTVNQPSKCWTPIADAGLRLLVGVGSTAAAYYWGSPLLAVFGLVLTVSGMGLVQVQLYHYSSHNMVCRSQWANTLLGRAISIIFLLKQWDHYRVEHRQHHWTTKIITEHDEFVQFVVGLCGLKPGRSIKWLWMRFWLNMFSPIFHMKFLWSRIRNQFFLSHVGYSEIALVYMVALAVGCMLYPILLLVWVLPLTIFLQMATVFRIVIEHRIPDQKLLDFRTVATTFEATNGVFPGSPMPPSCDWYGLIVWAFNMLFVQTFIRLTVLCGDAPTHDYHHRKPGFNTWRDASFNRLKDKTDFRQIVDYRDVWGLLNAVGDTLTSISNAKRDVIQPPR